LEGMERSAGTDYFRVWLGMLWRWCRMKEGNVRRAIDWGDMCDDVCMTFR